MKLMNEVTLWLVTMTTAVLCTVFEVRAEFVPVMDVWVACFVQTFAGLLVVSSLRSFPGHSAWVYRTGAFGGVLYSFVSSTSTGITLGLGITVVTVVASASYLFLRDKPKSRKP